MKALAFLTNISQSGWVYSMIIMYLLLQLQLTKYLKTKDFGALQKEHVKSIKETIEKEVSHLKDLWNLKSERN